MYRVHRGKLTLILSDRQHETFRPIATYLTETATSCPHDLFQEEHRASAAVNAFDLTGVEIAEKQNLKYGEMANFIPRDLDDLAEEIAVSMLRKHQRPDLLQAFFKHARLDL